MRVAAFFDADGTLARTDIVRASLFLARRASSYGSRVSWLGKIAASLPSLALGEVLGDRAKVNELHYASYRGVSEDRLLLLADELFESVIRPAIYPGAHELIEKYRAMGATPVMVTGALDFIARPLARYMRIEEVGANALLFQRGVATGEVRRPILAGAAKAAWVRRYAQREDIDLSRSFAFADDAADAPLLSMVGYPAAVNPSAGLLRIARENRWPILRLGTKEKGIHG